MIKIYKITTCLGPEINDSFYVEGFICYSSKNMATIERKMQQCINKIDHEKGFKICNHKTKFMHFCQIHKIHNHSALILNDNEIPIAHQYKFLRGCLHVMVKAMDCRIVVREFEPQLRYYIHFRTNTLGKGMALSYPPSYGLNSTTTVLLEGWVWHWITHKGWYDIKQRNQTNLSS